MPEPHPDSPLRAPAHGADLSPLAPFRLPVFRMLWITWLMANISMWMNDVAAAWMMTSLTASPIWVALVQTASTLPVFLLGLPSGALADILDRKRYFLVTQLWVAAVALLLSAVIFFGAVSPPLLLALTFANGVGLAMRWPVFAAIVPELVPRPQLPAALALNGVSMNASRIIGPLVAGALIASAGSAWVFVLNALLSMGAAVIILRWKRVHTPHPLGREGLRNAMRVGLQFVRQSSHLQGVLAASRCSSCIPPRCWRCCRWWRAAARVAAPAPSRCCWPPWARAPSWPRCSAAAAPHYARDALVLRGALLQSAAMVVVAFAPDAWVAVPAMFAAGMAWITTANTLSVSAQMGLPDWVRARGMSMYQMAIMGASALGAALWGQVATLASVPLSLCVAAATGVLTMWPPTAGCRTRPSRKT
jgi:predicted MFS family arabinose efflux permease